MNVHNLEEKFEKLIEYLCYCLIFALPISIAFVEVFSVLLILSWLIKQFYMLVKNPQKSSLKEERYFETKIYFWLPMIAFFIVSFISTLTSQNISLSIKGIIGKTGEHLLLCYIFIKTFSKSQNRKFKIVFFVIFLSALLIYSDALIQWFYGKDFIRGIDSRRLTASFKSPNSFAGWLIVVLPILISTISVNLEIFSKYLSITIKIFAVTLILCSIILLMKTVSKGAWVGFCFSLSLMFFLSIFFQIEKPKVAWLLYCGMLITVLLSYFILKAQVQQRIELFIRWIIGVTEVRPTLWKEAISIIKDYPLFGSGPNTYASIVLFYKTTSYSGIYPHNSYLQMAAEIGLIGLSSFLWMIFTFFCQGICALRKYKDPFLLGILCGLIAYLVHSFFDVNLFTLQLGILFWVVLGLGLARIKSLEKQIS